MSFDTLPPGVKPDDVAPSGRLETPRREDEAMQIRREIESCVEDLEHDFDQELVREVLQDVAEERL